MPNSAPNSRRGSRRGSGLALSLPPPEGAPPAPQNVIVHRGSTPVTPATQDSGYDTSGSARIRARRQIRIAPTPEMTVMKRLENKNAELEQELYLLRAEMLRQRAEMANAQEAAPAKSMGMVRPSPLSRIRPITFQEIKTIINENYNYQESVESTTLDIIAVYLRGQKILYTESKVYCEQHLYALMLPAILITAVCSVISVALKDYLYGAIIVSALTATNSFILSLVTYLKLDGKAEAHKTSAYSFETLQSVCEFSSGKILLNAQGRAVVRSEGRSGTMELIEEISMKVKEIKEKNQFILPEYIRYNYPILCSTNVFAEVKRIQNEEIVLINTLKNIMNDKMRIEEKINICVENGQDETTDEHMKLLEQKRTLENEALTQIIRYRNEYIEIDKKYREEIDNQIKAARTSWTRWCCVWLKT